MATPLTASVLIVTKNRKDELRVALDSVLRQTANPEVIVIDDGSTDGTSAMVAAEFPGVRLARDGQSVGYILRRNEGARLATGSVLFSLDDDAIYSTPDVVRATLDDFATPQVAAVAIPCIDVQVGQLVHPPPPDDREAYATARFKGTAYAVRCDAFLAAGGFRGDLVHQGEESDLSIRLLAAGYVVRLGRAAPIHHFESPRRDFQRMDFYGARNAVLFAWQNVPMPFVWFHLPVVIIRSLAHTFAPARFRTRFAGVVAGLRLCTAATRAPVPASTYRLWRTLVRGPRLISQLGLPIRPSAE